MREIVAKCDYGFDLHSAAATRTNFPNVRGDLSIPGVRALATAVGCELIVNGKGPEGSFRRAACSAGCPTVILEAGEVGKIEPAIVEVGLRGVGNLLIHLGLIEGTIRRPAYQARVSRTTWVRAELGGLLRFHVAPGDLVSGGQPLASNESVFGVARSMIIAPQDGIVLGMTTHPAVKPGEPVCHIAIPDRKIGRIRKALAEVSAESPEARIRDDLASSIAVSPTPPHAGAAAKARKPKSAPASPARAPAPSRAPAQGKTPRKS
jgi:predicted deacylase